MSASAPPHGAQKSGPRPRTPQPPLIFIVDDDADNRELLAELLQVDGYVCVQAADGSEALQKLTQTPVPALIILDLNMPELDGPGFMQRFLVEPSFATVPVVILSGHATGRQQAAELGADAFLVKPVAATALYETVASLINPAAEFVPSLRRPSRQMS